MKGAGRRNNASLQLPSATILGRLFSLFMDRITGVASCSDNQQAKAIPFAGLPNAAIPTVLICSKKHGN